KKIFPKEFTMISSYCRTVLVGDKVTLIGERINPTGKPKLKKALEEKNYTYILGEAVKQNEEGAEILDVNAGLPGIEEKTVLPHIIRQIQKVCDIPLQIDSSDYETMENAARVYNGKAVINSVNGKAESMEKVFPIAKKYGCCVIGLTLDENGIPKTAEKRVEIAQKIVSTAQEYGIPKKNILIDCLVLTASAEQENIIQTLKALRDVKYKLNVKTVLGVSNVSYGLPSRELLNKTFFVMAMSYGLDCAIVNTGNVEMMGVYDAFNVLSAKDLGSGKYIKKYAQQKAELPADKQENQFGLEYVLSKGLKGSIRESTLAELNKRTPMQIIDEIISPLLQTVGKKYENAELFLPQLMQTAEAVKAAFEVLKDHMKANGQMLKKGKILLATVRGDIHDIGKNIVKVVLENHGYEVIDLGKDVSEHDILKAAIENKVRLIGLSALMTTTVSSMESTIKYIKDNSDEFVFIVGGAVLNEEYATMIGADYYAKDALQAAEIVNSIFRE
ncbi:MAG TPA: dihydropteroate synthase, partial [Petrotogaceae bacterium]|nr:dihydropteroate synthase [Petrotogaceae bacterium]